MAKHLLFFIGELVSVIFAAIVKDEKKRLLILIVGTILSGSIAYGIGLPNFPFLKRIPTSIKYPTYITDAKGVEMVLVPEGSFTMGINATDALTKCGKISSDCRLIWFVNAEPPHNVYLDTFYIDRYEVTNAFYKICVDDGVCDSPTDTSSSTRNSYYGNSQFDNYPVIYVNWFMAKTFCEWRGAHLPTEAQWEKAARGTNGNIFPWGNDFDGSVVNFCDKNCGNKWANKNFDDGYNDTAPVNLYPSGMSPYGVYNMAGNVWEWILDWYDVYPGGDPTASNLFGQSAFGQTNRVIRGGSWVDDEVTVFSSYRAWSDPNSSGYYYGFRCAKDPNS